jgi:hypothetical protein
MFMEKILLPKINSNSAEQKKKAGASGLFQDTPFLPISQFAVAEAFKLLAKNSVWKLLPKKEQ